MFVKNDEKRATAAASGRDLLLRRGLHLLGLRDLLLRFLELLRLDLQGFLRRERPALPSWPYCGCCNSNMGIQFSHAYLLEINMCFVKADWRILCTANYSEEYLPGWGA